MSNKYRTYLERQKGQQQAIQQTIDKYRKDLEKVNNSIKETQEAQYIVQEVAKLTQDELKYHITELVTLALASVLNDPYEFEIEFTQRRNQTECDLYFARNGARIKPLEATGCGAVEVASFALRLVLWLISVDRTRPIFILDEPLKWLKGEEYPEKGMQMIKALSDKLNVQIIMITHVDEQIAGADRVHKVTRDKKQNKSIVTQI